MWRVIYGLGIPHVGAVAAKELALRLDGLDALMEIKSDEAAGAAAVSPRLAKVLADYFADVRNRAIVTDLIALGMRPTVALPEAADTKPSWAFVTSACVSPPSPTLSRRGRPVIDSVYAECLRPLSCADSAPTRFGRRVLLPLPSS